VVIGDLSQRQMVTKEHTEHLKKLHRSIYNDWGLYQFVQMLKYKCLLAGKELVVLDERDTSKTCSRCGQMHAMPLHKRTYRCGACGLVMDRDENSAVNIRERYLARLGPRVTDVALRADVFTAIDTFQHV
jgi:putative transposase